MKTNIVPTLSTKFKEYTDSKVEIYTEGSTITLIRDNKKQTIRVTNFFVHFLCKQSELVKRFFRLQFYNLVPYNNKLFISFGRNHYIYSDQKGLIRININNVRFLRGGITIHNGHIYAGEYFGNKERSSVNIWRIPISNEAPPQIVYTFEPGVIRHIHSIKYNKYENKFYVLTGDIGTECSIVKFTSDFTKKEIFGIGDESYRAIICNFFSDGFLYATDAEYVENYVYRVVNGTRKKIGVTDGPVFFSIQLNDLVVISSVYEGCPSQKKMGMSLYLYNDKHESLKKIAFFKKDLYSVKYFQFGQIKLQLKSQSKSHIEFSTIGSHVKNCNYKLEIIDEE